MSQFRTDSAGTNQSFGNATVKIVDADQALTIAYIHKDTASWVVNALNYYAKEFSESAPVSETAIEEEAEDGT